MTTLSIRPFVNSNPRFSSIIESFFNDEFPSIFNREWFGNLPMVNIKDTNESYQIEVAAPGFNKENFSVKVEDNILTISGTVNEEKENIDNEKYTRREFRYQSFTRSFTLPKKIDSTKITACYENGILKVILPKPEEEKVKGAVEIKVN
ncbi:MAG: Hsp20/alpha crystallin family protein [Chitinophagales bacterium]|nr:Hsp20/alpha crystallin family protein [Chitinophagales bacterium]MDW8273538.1 Hsp20/alpha crystallin family protein [Chitinophagales bacterium]